MRQHFFIHGAYQGTVPREKIWSAEGLYPPLSYAFFCPECGETWATCPIEGATTKWMVWTKACKAHPQTQFEVAGSLMLSWEKEFYEVFPKEVLVWEANRHLDYLDYYKE